MGDVNPAACTACGAAIRPGARFCVSCGAALTATPIRTRRVRPLQALRFLATAGGLATTVLGVVRLLDDDSARPAAAVGTTTAAAPTSTTERRATTSAAPAVQTCTNEQLGFAVDYPAGWHEGGTAEQGPCQWFNPEPFEIPEFSEVAVAVAVYKTPGDYDEWVAQFDEAEVFVVLDREELTIAGRRALRVHYEYTEGGVDPGAEGYEVVVDADGGPLTISAYEPFSADFAATRAVVDDMAASLVLT